MKVWVNADAEVFTFSTAAKLVLSTISAAPQCGEDSDFNLRSPSNKPEEIHLQAAIPLATEAVSKLECRQPLWKNVLSKESDIGLTGFL